MTSGSAVPPRPYDPADTKPTTFPQVLRDEIDRVQSSREKRGVGTKDCANQLTGLAFSGGGIRSATFNLGILQALAEKGLLRKFDYLSTVSGGGYIGSWLAAFIRRLTREPDFSIAKVEKALSPHKYETERRAEPSVFHWLRLYSNYLTPNKSVISGDTWAMLGTWMRNVLLNQTILGLMFMSAFVLCQSALLPLVLGNNDGTAFLIAGGLVLLAASISMAINVTQEGETTTILETPFQRVKVTATVLLPIVLSCILLNCGLWRTEYSAESIWLWMGCGAAFYFIAWGAVAIMAAVRRLWRKNRGKPKKAMVSVPALVVFSPLAGAAGGCLLRAYALELSHLPSWTAISWVVVVFGSGAVMVIILIVGTLHVGLVGRGSMDLVREWWARLGGYLTLMTLGWLLLAGMCAFGPLAVRWGLFELKGWSISAVLLWLLHNYLGLKAATSARTTGVATSVAKAKANQEVNLCQNGEENPSRIMSALKSPRLLNPLAKAAPYVFIVGLVLLLSTAVQVATGLVFSVGDTAEVWKFNSGMDWHALSDDYWRVLEMGSPVWLAGLGAIFFLAGLGLSWRVDVNEFSLHHFYRNRLVRCYLGASNPDRKPEPFTGFDSEDDVPLSDFSDDYPGPYPILNAALNITGGEELGYATRRAKSFAFTPLYAGYELGASGKGNGRFTCDNGFLPSFSRTVQGRAAGGVAKLGSECGISLGTAMAISGAAASPNMGYFTTPATAFYMALFDVRLGWSARACERPEPRCSAGHAVRHAIAPVCHKIVPVDRKSSHATDEVSGAARDDRCNARTARPLADRLVVRVHWLHVGLPSLLTPSFTRKRRRCRDGHHCRRESEGRCRQDNVEHQPRGSARPARPPRARGRRRPTVRADQATRSSRLAARRRRSSTSSRAGPAPQKRSLSGVHGIDVLPGTRELAGVELALAGEVSRETVLRDALDGLAYDQVVIDTPSNLGLLTVNALAAADVVIAPVAAGDEGAAQGVAELRATIAKLTRIRPTAPALAVIVTKVRPRRVIGEMIDDALMVLGSPRSCGFRSAPRLNGPTCRARRSRSPPRTARSRWRTRSSPTTSRIGR